MKVKVCGIRSEQDLLVAAQYGADAVGVLSGVAGVEDQPQQIAAALLKSVDEQILGVWVTELEDVEQIVAAAQRLQPDVIQLHGMISVADVAALREKVRQKLWKVVWVNQTAQAASAAYAPYVDGILFDTDAMRKGGSGKTHNWQDSGRLITKLRAEHPHLQLILAGGLNPENVQQAIETAQPDWVDASSGLTDALGNKDAMLCQQFIACKDQLNIA